MKRSVEVREALERRQLWGDQRDYEVMLACAHDKAALDAQVSGEEDNGLHMDVCLRIHHGYMAFGS